MTFYILLFYNSMETKSQTTNFPEIFFDPEKNYVHDWAKESVSNTEKSFHRMSTLIKCVKTKIAKKDFQK